MPGKTPQPAPSAKLRNEITGLTWGTVTTWSPHRHLNHRSIHPDSNRWGVLRIKGDSVQTPQISAIPLRSTFLAERLSDTGLAA